MLSQIWKNKSNHYLLFVLKEIHCVCFFVNFLIFKADLTLFLAVQGFEALDSCLSQLRVFQELQMDHTRTVLLDSLNKFVAETNDIKSLQKKRDKARSTYESVLSKQSKSTKSDPKIEQELIKTKDQFRSLNLEYVMSLNEYSKKKDFFIGSFLTLTILNLF